MILLFGLGRQGGGIGGWEWGVGVFFFFFLYGDETQEPNAHVIVASTTMLPCTINVRDMNL